MALRLAFLAGSQRQLHDRYLRLLAVQFFDDIPRGDCLGGPLLVMSRRGHPGRSDKEARREDQCDPDASSEWSPFLSIHDYFSFSRIWTAVGLDDLRVSLAESK